MPNKRVKQIPAERVELGKDKFEIRRPTSSGKTRHGPVDGTQSAGVACWRTVEEFHRKPPASHTLADLIHVWNNNSSNAFRQS
jgi:hypothetical protein